MDFIKSIRDGHPLNECQEVAESTMTCILGREAAYTGKVVTWDEMMTSTLQLVPQDLHAWDASLRPVPKPGMVRG